MNTKRIVAVTLLSLLVWVPYAFAEINWSADVETNTTFEADSNGTKTNTYTNDGRVNVSVEAKTENEDGTFVAGKGCYDVKVDGDMGVCDVWLQIGNPSFSLKIGAFENEGVFSKGLDIFVPGTDASQWYEVNKARGRNPDGMGVVFSAGSITFDTKLSYDHDGDDNQLGIRPVVKFGTDTLTVKAGGEYYLKTPQDTDADDEETWVGGGVDISMTMGTITIGGSGTYGKNEVTTVTDGVKTKTEETVMTATGYLKLKVGEDSTAGVGAGFTQEDEADTNEMYVYGSYETPLPIENSWVKFGAGFASGDNGSEDLSAYGGRIRFWYGF